MTIIGITMDQLQAIALVLEVVGFSIAFFHVYAKNFGDSIDKTLDLAIGRLGIGGELDLNSAIDYEKSWSEEKKERIWKTRLTNILYLYLLTIGFMLLLDFGEALVWLIPEFLVAAILANITLQILQPLVRQVVLFVFSAIKAAGKGDTAAGIGFGLAGLGILIECYQVAGTPYKWLIAILFVLIPSFILLIALLWNNYRRYS